MTATDTGTPSTGTTTAPPRVDRDALWIGGEWVPPTGSGRLEVVNAATEQVMGSVPEGTAADVEAAVAAARAAFPAWAATPVPERAAALQRVSEGLNARQTEIAALVAQEVGMPFLQANVIQVGLPAITFAATADHVRGFAFSEELGNSLVVREPVGVVGAITPWNYPLHQIAAKVAPALAAGCTVVLKPSEVTPLNAFVLAEVMAAAGVPAGVFNLVTGVGTVVGEAVTNHPDVDMVSFTGSTAAGRRVMAAASATVKRVALELGGKSPMVLLPDVDVQTAVVRGVAACYLNSGQTCSALTRMVVPRSLLPQVEAVAAAVAAQTVVGDPFDPATNLGPLVSEAQRDRVRGYIQTGIDEGAKLVAGGPEPPEGLETGYYVRPTVFSEVTPAMRIHREEIFGPVLVIEPYDDSGPDGGEAAAVALANDTIYGLAAGVFGGDRERALRVARQVRAGQVEVNGGLFNPLAPFGGYKQSGTGRELGPHGLTEFLETKAIQL